MVKHSNTKQNITKHSKNIAKHSKNIANAILRKIAEHKAKTGVRELLGRTQCLIAKPRERLVYGWVLCLTRQLWNCSCAGDLPQVGGGTPKNYWCSSEREIDVYSAGHGGMGLSPCICSFIGSPALPPNAAAWAFTPSPSVGEGAGELIKICFHSLLWENHLSNT